MSFEKKVMVKNIIFIILGLLTFGAGFAMFVIGNSNSKLSELKDFWFMPIPLGLIFLIAGIAGMLKRMSAINKQ